MKYLVLIALLLSLGVAHAKTTSLVHKSGGTTEVTTTPRGTDVKSTSMSSGDEKNTQGHKKNVDRVKQEGDDRGDPVVKPNGRAPK